MQTMIVRYVYTFYLNEYQLDRNKIHGTTSLNFLQRKINQTEVTDNGTQKYRSHPKHPHEEESNHC